MFSRQLYHAMNVHFELCFVHMNLPSVYTQVQTSREQSNQNETPFPLYFALKNSCCGMQQEPMILFSI